MKRYKLGEISEILTGSTPSTKDKDNYGGDIIWVTPKDLSDQNSKYFYQGARNITQKGLKECGAKIIPANSILMSSRAPIGLLAINKVECCTNQGFKSIVLDKSLADENYLYYYLKYHINEIHALGSGTTFREVSKPTLERYEIKIHDLPEQRKIGQVLSSIDDKIAVNNRINALFEQVARAVYEYYFIQFDFPDKQGKPYKQNGGVMTYNKTLHRPIPPHFEVISLKDICDIKSGYPFSTNDYTSNGKYKIITIKNVLDGYISSDTDNTIDFIPKNMPDYCALQVGDILLSLTGNVGRVGIVFENDLLLNQRVGVLNLKNPNYRSFVYLTFSQRHFKETLENISTGSNQKNLSPIETEKLPILFSQEIIEKFEIITKQLLEKIINNNIENSNLKTLRDFLLPLLMNEQARI